MRQHASEMLKLIYKHRAAYLFILPSFTFFSVFMLYPVIRGFILAFQRYRVPPEPNTFVGFSNFVEVANDFRFMRAIVNTFTYTAFVVVGILVISLFIAMMIFPQGNKTQSFYKSLYYLPGVTSGLIVAIQWRWIFNPAFGLLNAIMIQLGLEPVNWLGSPQTAMPSIIFMDVSRGDGAAILLLLASLHAISPDVFEAAAIDGASRFQTFWRITLPLLKPIMLYLVVMGTINAMQVFVPMFVLTRGGPEHATVSLAYEIYQFAFFRMMRFDLAAALGVMLFLFIMVLSIIFFKLLKDDVSY